ncbi:MAG: ribosome-associated translation inhibitor RaiA [Bacteriovoracaceae bacterium]|jgi:putative sigma-54 modulation protein|nr:ribosome-associated translation inhibitor RaiA [Bacteriovoracaceae bacterium]
MEIKISFKHLEHTEALDERIKEKTQKLEKWFEGMTSSHWTCSVEKGDHIAEVKIVGPHFDYHASAKSDSLYKCLDLAVAKLEKQLGKKKDKWKNHIHHKHEEKTEFVDSPEVLFDEHDEDKFDDVQ